MFKLPTSVSSTYCMSFINDMLVKNCIGHKRFLENYRDVPFFAVTAEIQAEPFF